MHGVIVHVKIDSSRRKDAVKILNEVTVPRAKAIPGFVSGTWFRALESDRGIGVQLFVSEESARAAADEIRSEGPPPEAPVTMESVEAFEIVAQA